MTAFNIQSYPSRRWYLIDGWLPAHRRVLRVWVVLRLGSEEHRIPLPASLKGRVVELLPRPSNRHELTVELEDESGPLATDRLKVSVIPGPFAWYLLFKRLSVSFFKLDRDRAKRMGMSWGRILGQPFGSYRLMGSLRYHFPPPDYAQWRSLYWSFTKPVRKRLIRYLKDTGRYQSTVPVIVDNRTGRAGDERELKSQVGLNTRVHRVTDLSDGVATADPEEWLLFLRSGVQLEPWALAWFLAEASAHPGARMIYSDHAQVSEDGTPLSPYFKPDWSPELQRASHYVGDCVLVKASAFAEVCDALGYTPEIYELTLELAVSSEEFQVRHIPAVLWHCIDEGGQARPELLNAHCQRHSIEATVGRDTRGHLRIRYGLPVPQPKISIVVPTRDMLKFLQPCVDSILRKTTWSNYEVLILDNQSQCPDTLAYMDRVSDDPRVRVLAYDRPFNFSAINNFAVEHANGDLICLLNNDTEVTSPDWLEEMASRLLQPDVGAVGARLYFADGRVQHAGDVLGPGGCANHLHGIIDADDPGYMNRAILPQELSAVTAACLLTYRSLYQKLGGLDEANLAVAFNDVDFCLRVREAGYRVLYTPYAELYHYESVSRGKDNDPIKRARAKREVTYMRERWANVIERDPYYNPNLNYAKPDFTLGKYPRVDWPW